MTLRDCAPIHGFTDFQGLYQSNHGMARNHETGSFVNHAVRDLVGGGEWSPQNSFPGKFWSSEKRFWCSHEARNPFKYMFS